MTLSRAVILICLIVSISPVYSTTITCSTFNEKIESLALNIYHEARNQGKTGMLLVGEVTINRVNHSRYPNSICSVIRQRNNRACQFSWVCQKRDYTPYEKESWWEAVAIAEEILDDDYEFISNGATHFLNPRIVKRMPRWTRVFEEVYAYNSHIFFKKPE